MCQWCIFTSYDASKKKRRYPKFWGISIKFPSITWVGCFLFRNVKPWRKVSKNLVSCIQATQGITGRNPLISLAKPWIYGSGWAQFTSNRTSPSTVRQGQHRSTNRYLRRWIHDIAWLHAKRLSRCQAACKSRKDSWPRCTGSPAAILASRRG